MWRRWFVRPVVKDGVEARQGYLDRPVLVVLVVSLVLALVALGILIVPALI